MKEKIAEWEKEEFLGQPQEVRWYYLDSFTMAANELKALLN